MGIKGKQYTYCSKGRSSTKIVGGRVRGGDKVVKKSEKIRKRLHWISNFLCFFRSSFKYVQDFSCSSKQILRTFFFLQGFFFIKIQKTFQFILKTFRPSINFYINSFSASTNTVAPRFIPSIENIIIEKIPKRKVAIPC